MIERLIDFAATNRWAVILACAVAALLGWWSFQRMPLDVLPDISDTQVIVNSRWERSPDILEDQVTYPLVSALVGAPGVKAVRGISDFGYSFVYVVFNDGVDLYWARSRVQELLSGVTPRLPQGVKVELGPDATSVGWIFQYTLKDSKDRRTLDELRSVQDWYVRSHLRAVRGVADVASLGGHVRQYQVLLDPNRLRAKGVSITQVVEAVRSGNSEVGGRIIESAGSEFMIRGRGYAKSIADFENMVVAGGELTTPIRVKDIAQVTVGPELRRGVADLDGQGDVVSGIVVMRQGENALEVIDAVKSKLKEIAPGLPEGVSIEPIYDRSTLIGDALSQAYGTLLEIVVTVSLVILLFLWHPASALIPLLTIPASVVISFAALRTMGVNINIMTLGGIALATGALVDAAIVMVEQCHKHLERWQDQGAPGDARPVLMQAIREVGRPSFFALLAMAVAFVPVLALEGQEGRLFRPMALTMLVSLCTAAGLAVTLDPALRLMLLRTTPTAIGPLWLRRSLDQLLFRHVSRELDHPVSRRLMQWYRPAAEWSLRNRATVFAAALLALAGSVPLYTALAWDAIPSVEEGSLLYMPSTMPGISVSEAQKLLQVTDRILKRFPEVDRVLGKAGRAETPSDPAPLSMLETVVTLKPVSQWRKVPQWYSSWAPDILAAWLRRWWPDHLTKEELVADMDRALTIPGVTNSWTMPIRGRVDMLSTGIRTPVGLKLSGPDLEQIEVIGALVEQVLLGIDGTRAVFAERTGSGNFLDIEWNRDSLARYGLSLEMAQAAVQNAIGGENVSSTVEGRARYPVNVRYNADFRSDIQALSRVLVSTPGGERQVPLAQLAQIRTARGPAMIRNENGLLTGYITVDLAEKDSSRFIEEARLRLDKQLRLPEGYTLAWSGQYESVNRVRANLRYVVPITLGLVILLIYLNTRSAARTGMVLLAVPFSAIGAICLVHMMGLPLTAGVWVGLLALLGVDAATGVFMLLYLDLAYAQAQREGRLNSRADLRAAVIEGSAMRLRPKFMTAATMLLGLMPLMWSTGPGAEVMKQVATPMVGGILTSFVLELLIYPALFETWKWHLEVKHRLA